VHAASAQPYLLEPMLELGSEASIGALPLPCTTSAKEVIRETLEG
jgi:hypothetical protein